MKKIWFLLLSFILNNQTFANNFKSNVENKTLLKRLEGKGSLKSIKSLNSSKTGGGGNVGPKIEK